MKQDPYNYLKRRLQLCADLQHGVAIIPNYKPNRYSDGVGHFCSESNFYYLTGFNEANSILMIHLDTKTSIFFCEEKNPEQEVWTGLISGTLYNQQYYDEVYPIQQFSQYLEKFLLSAMVNVSNVTSSTFYQNQQIQDLYYNQGNVDYDEAIFSVIARLRKQRYQSNLRINDINSYIANKRKIKDSTEIALIKTAIDISAQAHISCMKKIKTMTYEYELEAEFLAICYQNGQRNLAYNSICAGGANACTLHYNKNSDLLNPKDLVLVDAGVKFHNYTSDITRTYPVGGIFSQAQQAIYEIVLEANVTAINAIKIGGKYTDHGDVALKIIIQGLIDLGLLQGNLQDNIENKNYRKFYMHSIGHFLGLDVHDVGAYEDKPGVSALLQENMVFTVEPGIYIRPDADVAPEYWNIGVRIEDNILVTRDAAEVLSRDVPKLINEMRW